MRGRYFPLVAAMLTATPACQEYSYTSNIRTDVFQQKRVNAVDLLIVIDNSCSMVEEQDNLAVSFDALIQHFQEADVDWRLAVTTTDAEVTRYRGRLMRGDDEIVIRGLSGEIDRVAYDRDWAFEAGISLQLDGNDLDRAANDSVENWCAGSTPGQRNPGCDGEPADAISGADSGQRPPVSNDLVITEIMARSEGLDSRCEWFELTSNTPDTLDLSGLEIFDDGRNYVTIDAGTTLEPGGVLVIGRELTDNCETPVDIAFAEGLTLNDDVGVIGPDTPDADELFSEAVAQGTIGAGIEMGLEAARLVFEEPQYTDENDAWLRNDANLSILFVSDEDDLSPRPAWEYVRYYTDLKGDQAYRDRRMVNLSAVVADTPPPRDELPSCSNDNGVGWYGERYLEVAAETEGLISSICEEDFGPMVRDLGLTLSGLEVEFALSGFPNLSTLKVALYEDDANDAKVRDLEAVVDYTYVADGNYLFFSEEQVPPSEMWISAEYEVLPDSASPSR